MQNITQSILGYLTSNPFYYNYSDISNNLIFTSIIIIIALTYLLIASITDIKTREVPDWLNYSLIFLAIGIRIIFSIYIVSIWPIVFGITGALIGLGIALALFYLGQWGGGDSKMIIGLGTLFGFTFNLNSILALDFFHLLSNVLILFIVNIFIFGTVYGMIWSIILAARTKGFSDTYKEICNDKNIRIYKIISFVIAILLIPTIFLLDDMMMRYLILALAALILLTYYLVVFVKAVEKGCMIKIVDIEKLTEGDWIPEDIYVKGKYITGPKELGISKEQISTLLKLKKEKKISRIKIKEGIPFIPSFLFSVIAILLLGNWLFYFI